jgi:hypothetical protein
VVGRVECLLTAEGIQLGQESVDFLRLGVDDADEFGVFGLEVADKGLTARLKHLHLVPVEFL